MSDSLLHGALMELNTDKDVNAIHTMRELFNMTQQIFKYTGLPTTIPQGKLETILQRRGKAFIANHNDALYAFDCAPDGTEDVYGDPTGYIISNNALGITGTVYKNGLDGILMKNTEDGSSLLYKIAAYAATKAESDVTLNNILVKSRLPWVFIAKDEDTKESMEITLDRLIDGDMSVILTDGLFSESGAEVTPLQSGAQNITHVIELVNYMKSDFFESLGINRNDNMKRQYVSGDELTMNDEATKPLVDNMLATRQRALDEINAMFDLDIKVEMTSAWHGHTEPEEIIEDEFEETSEDSVDENEVTEDVDLDHSHEAEVNETLEEDLTAGEVLDTHRLLDGEEAKTTELEAIVNEAQEIESGNSDTGEDVLEEEDNEEGEPEVVETGGSDEDAESSSDVEDEDDEKDEVDEDEKKTT